ncbi:MULTISPECIES: MurR/RpiR family transcriptional regulator [unclassified Enterococcus]|uniref:MurR/RpiR family transcriptional regulator n=1 Tax=unclassified Enterococcus TaxID=2608891 RepID=UPI0015521EE9|nr:MULTISPECIES: MurR/RpiR family transcriptional regulator [unclassified Enterococcus]MBS7577478.1 MurR/RpiR family transcriptional regulator [Enterococcus sp. MMGLQ5-2]MBS7584884.1 MurR/RpiR family transcriptional regulator [Enterococcus sp. MMGLQ5-1]NPD12739.1 MurR/RpiR family transcriptional regulator [Enterococcus sp. MMGLQ5-1]NPD37310.1 MurR/RpiR family transcriptional regulator [Enterococcus sp. MMGLQ5-2]
MTILDQIQQNYHSFFNAEKKIADYILANAKEVFDLPIAVLAEKSHVSEATISRFCKKLSLTGFHQLKIELAKLANEPEAQTIPFKKATLTQRLEQIAHNKSTEILATTQNIDVSMLKKVLRQLEQTRIIHFTASGNTTPVAIDAAYRFNQIGLSAVVFESWQTQLAYTMNMQTDDLLVVISNSGEAKVLLKNIEIAQKKGIKILAITNHPKSPIAKLSDYHLTTMSHEHFFHKEYYFSRIAAMYVIELLFLLLSESQERKAHVRLHEDYLADEKI